MIPKTIHYCWLSDEPYPEEFNSCLASWKANLPDYDFQLWNFNRFDINSSLWVKQAFENKKYAFAADYIRLYALYNYGGIYLDMDVEVLKPFDNLLNLPYFIGKEFSNEDCSPEAATIGAEQGCYWIGKCLEYYKNQKFVIGIGKYNTSVLPSIMKTTITQNYNFISISNKDEFIYDNKTVCIFPVDFFSPKNYQTLILKKTQDTYSIHHFANSWNHNKTLLEKIRHIVLTITIHVGIYRLYQIIKKK